MTSTFPNLCAQNQQSFQVILETCVVCRVDSVLYSVDMCCGVFGARARATYSSATACRGKKLAALALAPTPRRPAQLVGR